MSGPLHVRSGVPAGIASGYAHWKRLLDIGAAGVGVVVGLPVFAAVALAVYLDDPGPVIFQQTRSGRFHRPFTIYKFRTMRVGTPSLSTEEMRARGISPVTQVGAVLRRTSLDELPQLWNILRGDMSFVGPRPALPSQSVVLEGRARAGVDALAPGITGLAQATGRDDLDDAEKVRRDASYLHHFGLAQDLRILWLTVRVVVGGAGAR